MLKVAKSYEEACRTFRWRVPERYNIAFDVCDRQTMAGADGHRTALTVEAANGSVERYTFLVLRTLSNRLANVLRGVGVEKGDRVLVSCHPSVEAAVSVLAILRMGAVVVPVPPGLGEVPLAWRLADSGAIAAIVHADVAPRLLAARQAAPDMSTILVADRAVPGCAELWPAMETAGDTFTPEVTEADDPAFLFYPEHGVGKPPGVLHAHRAVPGNLPPVEMALGFFPQTGDVLWTAAEWMGFQGLLWAILPAWHHGVPVVAGPHDLGPDQQLALMGRHGVRAAVIPQPRLMALAEAAMSQPHPIPRALATGPGLLTDAQHRNVQKIFGTDANEIWGGVETGAVAANLSMLMELRPGSPGRATPGVTVEAVDGQGHALRAGTKGMLAVAPGAPGCCLRHWQGADPLHVRLPTGWLATGILGHRDLDGYLWPDDAPMAIEGAMSVGGMLVRLSDVEETLCWHSKVAAAAVRLVGSEIKALVVPAQGGAGDLELARDLQAFVATRRAEHEVPRRIEFVQSLPSGNDGNSMLDSDDAEPPLRLDAPSPEDRLTFRRR